MLDPNIVAPILKSLLLKVFTPIMSFTLVFFGMIAWIIFEAHSVDSTFDFGRAIWCWVIMALLFTPLLGAIMWVQTIRVIDPKKASRKRPTALPKTGS